MDENLSKLVSELLNVSRCVRAEYNDLFDKDLNTIPIPFFGNLRTAKVVTVGLNPSDGELRERSWPQLVDTPILYERLTGYFNNSRFPPHPWFDTWNKALCEIDVSYANGNAAHIDLCPWATRPASTLDQNQFECLVTQNLCWFWQCIQLIPNLRLVIMAGAVTKRYYMNEFLIKKNNVPDLALIGKVHRKGKAFVNFHEIRMQDKAYPVFFCSVSPSARTAIDKKQLPNRIKENREQLLKYLV